MSKKPWFVIVFLIMAFFVGKILVVISNTELQYDVQIAEHTLPLSVENATAASHEKWRISMSNVTLQEKTEGKNGDIVMDFLIGSDNLNILLTAKNKAQLPRNCDLKNISTGDKVNIIIVPTSSMFQLSYIAKQAPEQQKFAPGRKITEAEFRAKYADFLKLAWIIP